MIGIGRSDLCASTSFDSFDPSVGNEVHVTGSRGEPEDQFVEEQHHSVVAEPLEHVG